VRQAFGISAARRALDGFFLGSDSGIQSAIKLRCS
jgi:hypothetical protein